MAGVLVITARMVRLGFLANFLSRTVLIGFLTGVGVQVAAGQVGEMLGLHGTRTGTVGKMADVLGHLGATSIATLAVSAAGLVVILGTPDTPGATTWCSTRLR